MKDNKQHFWNCEGVIEERYYCQRCSTKLGCYSFPSVLWIDANGAIEELKGGQLF